MEHLYQWAQSHTLYMSLISVAVAFVLGLGVRKAKKVGFAISQFVRHFFGAKVEAKLEELVDGIDEGMHSDNATPGVEAAKKAAENSDIAKAAEGLKNLALLLAIGALFLFPQRSEAVEKVDAPFKYLLSTMDITPNVAYWGITPTIILPDLMITQSATRAWNFTAVNGVAVGLNYGRYVATDTASMLSNAYETFGFDMFALYTPAKEICLGAGADMLNRKIGFCGGFKITESKIGKQWFVGLTTGFKPY